MSDIDALIASLGPLATHCVSLILKISIKNKDWATKDAEVLWFQWAIFVGEESLR
jgi:hypothetical protein